jgi:hypothetical protein
VTESSLSLIPQLGRDVPKSRTAFDDGKTGGIVQHDAVHPVKLDCKMAVFAAWCAAHYQR